MIRRSLGALALCLLACQSAPPPLGRFRVVATRTGNTCGAQAGGYAPRAEFDVTLSVADGALTWAPPAANTARGTWDARALAFRIAAEEAIPAWPADRRREIAGCTLLRTDVIEGVVEMEPADGGASDDASAQDGGAVDAGAAGAGGDAGALRARSFRGNETIVFGAMPGVGDCRPIVGAGDGQFNALPCEIRYSLEARRID